MAFAIRNFPVLAYAQGFTLWLYRAPAERLDDVAADGYFNDAREMVNAGDMVMVTARDGGRVIVIATAPGASTVRTWPLT